MPLIDNLLTLYEVDRQVRSLQKRVESAQIYLNVQNNKIESINIERAENEQQLMQRKANIAVVETETGSIDTRVEHLRDELNKAVNDKEYKALLAEMNTLKDRRKAFEDEELAEMVVVEKLEATGEEINSRAKEREKVQKVAKTELMTRQEEIAEQLAELEKERTVAAAEIPEVVLADFNEIADDYEGETMAPIEIIDKKRREYSCTSCSLHLPIETVSVLMGNKDAVVQCGQCDRILFLEESSREVLAPAEK